MNNTLTKEFLCS